MRSRKKFQATYILLSSAVGAAVIVAELAVRWPNATALDSIISGIAAALLAGATAIEAVKKIRQTYRSSTKEAADGDDSEKFTAQLRRVSGSSLEQDTGGEIRYDDPSILQGVIDHLVTLAAIERAGSPADQVRAGEQISTIIADLARAARLSATASQQHANDIVIAIVSTKNRELIKAFREAVGDVPIASTNSSVADDDEGIEPDDAEQVQEIFFATNRTIIEGQPLPEAASDRWSDQTSYGCALVNIPRQHRIGEVERPKRIWWKFRREKEQKDKHFVILEAEILSTELFFADLFGANSALIFVHGYNTSFEDALFKTAQIAFDSNYPGKAIAFSWPSAASALSYDYDRECAAASPQALLELLRRLKSESNVENLFIVAHSLGSQVAIEALHMASLSELNLDICEVVFAAPDVDRNVFKTRAALIKEVSGGVTLYASSADKALIASKTKAGGPRAGDMPTIGPLLIPGIDLIDVTALGDDMFALNHGVFSSDRSILDDLGRIVSTGTRPPHVRTPTLRQMPDRVTPRYWMYPR